MIKRKLLAVAVMVLAIFMLIPFAASAESQGDWVCVTDGYYEYYQNGYKYTDGEYWIDYSTYRFDANGRMLNGEWYRDPYSYEYYYYQAGGRRAENCILWIDSAYYGFDWNGRMFSNEHFELYDETNEERLYYYAEASGALKTNQWVWFADEGYEEGGYWKYYGPYGATFQGIQSVNGVYYYFHYDGSITSTEATHYVYDEKTDSHREIRVKNGGALYCNEWYSDDWGDWFYFGYDCFAARGKTVVGSVTYYFSEYGRMLKNEIFYDSSEGRTYFIEGNGVATSLYVNGWTKIKDDWYYCIEGAYCHDDFYWINSGYYYFDYSGKMLNDEVRYMERYDEEYDYYYDITFRAKPGGVVCCGEWYQNDELDFEYYGWDFDRYEDDIYTIGDAQYYFQGSTAVRSQLVESYGEVYFAGSNCVLEKLPHYSWYNFENEFYYVLEGYLAYDEIVEINGIKYGFDYDGRMIKNTFWYFEEEIYDPEFDDYYYYGSEYLFSKSGAMITNPGWNVVNDNWYYVNDDGSLYSGELKENGTIYCLYPYMEYSKVSYTYDYDENGKHCYLYATGPDGKLYWITEDGYYSTYYGRVLVENGELVTGWKQIGSNWYYFDPEIHCGGLYYIYDDENDTESGYYFDDNGVMQSNCWIEYDGSYIYLNEYGKAANGIYTIGSTPYMFIDNRLIYNSYTYEPVGIYVSDANGVATLLSDGNGWKSANGYDYYVQYGRLLTGYNEIYVGDRYIEYRFDYSGRLVTNTLYGDYYYDEYGQRYEGWKQLDEGWAYFRPYRCNNGLYTIAENKYFFENGIMLSNTTHYALDYNMVYVIDAYGIVVDSFQLPDGAYYENGDAYLYQNGEAYDGWYGENYFTNGRMLIDEMIKINGIRYYFDNHGKYIHNGWYKLSEKYDEWIYAAPNGDVCYNEWLQLGNDWYYFDDYYMLSDGIFYIKAADSLGKFDEYGRFIDYIEETYEEYELADGPANSWQYKDGEWYYYNSTGKIVVAETVYIGNAWYSFDWDGCMLSNEFSYDYYGGIGGWNSYGGYDDYYGYGDYYYTASGARLEAFNKWELINGDWYYFDANGRVVTGWIEFNGLRYFATYHDSYDEIEKSFTIEYELYTGYRLIDGTVYYFDATGLCHGAYIGNGWLQLSNGDFVYFRNGELLTDGIYNIGGADYYFYSDGTLMQNSFAWDENSEKAVYASETGVLYTTGWHNTKDGWIYVDAVYGLCSNGVYNIGGGIYFFDNGYWVP